MTNSDLCSLKANRVDAQNRTQWRKIIRGREQANLGDLQGSPGQTYQLRSVMMSVPLNNDNDNDDDEL